MKVYSEYGKRFVKYKKKKYYLEKEHNTTKDIIKHVLSQVKKEKALKEKIRSKIVKTKIPNKKYKATSTLKSNKQTRSYRNEKIQLKKGNRNNQYTESKEGALSYINLLRAQQQLPPLGKLDPKSEKSDKDEKTYMEEVAEIQNDFYLNYDKPGAQTKFASKMEILTNKYGEKARETKRKYDESQEALSGVRKEKEKAEKELREKKEKENREMAEKKARDYVYDRNILSQMKKIATIYNKNATEAGIAPIELSKNKDTMFKRLEKIGFFKKQINVVRDAYLAGEDPKLKYAASLPTHKKKEPKKEPEKKEPEPIVESVNVVVPGTEGEPLGYDPYGDDDDSVAEAPMRPQKIDTPEVMLSVQKDKMKKQKESIGLIKQYGFGLGLTNLQINEYMKKYNSFLGCYASDQIDQVIKKIKPGENGSFIMNTDVSTGPGIHWVAINWTKNSLEYYDPLGDPPTEQFKEEAKKLSEAVNPNGFLRFKINHIKRQANTTDTCGYHAMKFIIDRINGKSFAEASGFNNHRKIDYVDGEKDVDKFIKHLDGDGFKYISGSGVVGDIRPEQKLEMDGDGIVDGIKAVAKRISDIFQGTRKRASPSIRKFMEANGESKISKIVIGRIPVTPGVEKVANLLSLGKYEQNKKKLQYDKMFHLFMVISLDNGKTFKLEKNHLPELSMTYTLGKDTINVSKPNTTFNEFIANAEKKAGGSKLWVYDAFNANCQYFVKWCLQGSNVYSDSIDKFVMQDAYKVIEGLSWFEKLARKVTDLANVADVAINGGKKVKLIECC